MSKLVDFISQNINANEKNHLFVIIFLFVGVYVFRS